LKSMRILTTLRIANHGGILFADSLQRAMASAFPHYEARYLDYIPRDRKYYEWLRMFKPHRKAPLFNLRRHNHLQKFINQSIPHERLGLAPFGYERIIKLLAKRNYDALVVGMVIWDITYKAYLSNFPNAYWLSEKIPAVKIAYAVSGHRTNLSLVKQFYPHIKRILDSYALIGVRDDLTAEIVTESKLDAGVPVVRLPDPTFLYEYGATQARQILARYDIDLNRPILGLLVYGKSAFSRELCNFYRQAGFQIVAMSMLNPHADANLGHILNPYEWAEIFNYLSFCVTDRFHGTIFCLKANKPFIAIEPYAPESLKNSKIYCLLKDFGMTEYYANVYREDFRIADFLSQAESLRNGWNSDLQARVSTKVQVMRQRNLDFIERMKNFL
jgi:hypothetical protein